MSGLRPEVLDTLSRWREVIMGGAVVGLGLWLAVQGGYLLVPVGGAVGLLGAGWAVTALRRLRFAQAPDGPGVVELVEGQIAYLGPRLGGQISLSDLVELRLLRLQGRRVWRLKQADGQALLIPVDAVGAEGLFDAFGSLPGMDMQALVAALRHAPPTGGQVVALATESRLVWTRAGRGLARS